MESMNKKIIFIAVIMAFITTFLVYFYVSSLKAKPETDAERMSVFVAVRDLTPKHKITEGDIKEERVLKEYLNVKAVRDRSEILGRLVKDTIMEGEQILKDRLVSDGETNLVYNVPDGKRAVSINVNEQIGVANLVRPGDYVDIIASFEKEEVEDKYNKIVYPRTSKIVLQNLLVLASGQEQMIAGDKTAEMPKTVTLAVTPGEAEKLVFITEYATVRMILRPVGDNSAVKTEGVTRNDLVTGKDSREVPYTQGQDALSEEPAARK